MVRNQEDQVKMALKKLTAMLKNNSSALVMLEYSDNKNWVEKTVKDFGGVTVRVSPKDRDCSSVELRQCHFKDD